MFQVLLDTDRRALREKKKSRETLGARTGDSIRLGGEQGLRMSSARRPSAVLSIDDFLGLVGLETSLYEGMEKPPSSVREKTDRVVELGEESPTDSLHSAFSVKPQFRTNKKS